MEMKDQATTELRQQFADLQKQIQQQGRAHRRTEKAEPEKKTSASRELELQLAKAQKDSSTSSKAPSSDIVKPPKKNTDRRKKTQRGGQKGHERNLRKPLPPERVDKTTLYEIDARRGFASASSRRPMSLRSSSILNCSTCRFYVTEHRLRKYRDGNGNTVLPEVPGTQRPTPVRPAPIGPDRLAQVARACELHDHRNLHERRAASPGVTRLSGEAV